MTRRERASTKGLLRVLLVILVVAVVLDISWFTRRFAVKNSWLEPQPILSVATLILGFLLLNWQLDTQHRNTLEAHRQQGQDRLKLDIFKEIAERIEATRVPISELGGTPTAFVGELIVRRKSGIASHYQSQLQSLPKEAADSVIALMATLENYEIAMPGFVVFSQTLADLLDRARVAFGDFFLVAYPIAGPQTHPMFDDNREDLSRLAHITERLAWDLTIAIADLRVAAQNYLLGGLFPDRRVPERTPLDPSLKVTKLPDV